MLKLMKYELRKTWMTKVILLALTACAEAAYLIGLYAEQDGPLSVGIGLLCLLAVFGVLVIGLESVVVLHRDMNTKQSYMLFMTPNSCYKILGAKVLECGISILLTAAFFFALGTLDITLLFAREGPLNDLWQQIQSFLSHITIDGRQLEINMPVLASLTFYIVSDWICLVVTAYLADVISSALLYGRKFNGVISFVFFLILNWGIGKLISLITSGIAATTAAMAVAGGLYLVFAVIMYIVTAQIMEKYLSV